MIAVPPLFQRVMPKRPRINWASPLTRGLVACWPMNEGVGARVQNIVTGQWYTSTLTWVRDSSPFAVQKGARFSGYVDLGTLPRMIGVPAFSFVCWNLATAGGDGASLFTCHGGSAGWGVAVGTQAANKVAFQPNGSGNVNGSAAVAVNDGYWHHVAVTTTGVSGAPVNFYLDGLDNGTSTLGATIAQSTSSTCAIGNSGQGTDGYVSTVMIYNRVITANEIAALYRQPMGIFQPSRSLIPQQRGRFGWNGAAGSSFQAAWARRSNQVIGIAGAA